MIDVTGADLTKVYDLCRKIVEYYKEQLEENNINASGTLSRSADFDIDFDEYHLAVYFIMESYWYYTEKGRNKSTGKWGDWNTKYRDIEQWLRNKIGRGKFIPSSSTTIPRTDKEIKKVAGAIVHKITKYGFYGYDHHGLHPLENTLKEAETAGIIDKIVDCVMDEFDKRVTIEFMKI